ncbi:uncharacterized protein [Chelonus insularis]|uniref:uncharacterized protein n=1 Tax=Chelonus insularis TaxID=460826 RepID=UPI00158D1A7F|nr:uncharacterized protein LOC118064903 [Chelonus insularis]
MHSDETIRVHKKMNLNSLWENLNCSCQNFYRRINNEKVPSILRNSSQSFLLPLVLRKISHEWMKTTYQHDFGQLHKHPSIIYGNSIMVNDSSKKSSTLTRKLDDDVECRPPPKLPYLYGHNIPGRKRQKSLLPEMNNNENRHNINIIHVDNRKKVYLLKDRRMTNPTTKTKTKIHNDNSSFTDENHSNNRSSNINTRESRTKESTNTITDGANNGLYPDSIEKLNINRRLINTNSSTDKKTGDIIEKFSVSPWTSEYQDTIGGTAEKILKIQLHSHKRHKMINNHKAT